DEERDAPDLDAIGGRLEEAARVATGERDHAGEALGNRLEEAEAHHRALAEAEEIGPLRIGPEPCRRGGEPRREIGERRFRLTDVGDDAAVGSKIDVEPRMTDRGEPARAPADD